MKKAAFHLVWNRRGQTNSQGKAPVEIYAQVDGQKKYYRTGVTITKEQWDESKRQVNKNHPSRIKLNHMLQGMLTKLEEYELDIIRDTGVFTWTDLQNFSFDEDRGNFVAWLEAEIKVDNTVSPSTRKYRLVMLEKLKDVTGPYLSFSRVNYQLLEKFNNKMAGEGLQLSTMRKYHNQLQKFISVAARKGIMEDNPYKSFRVKKPPRGMKKCLFGNDLERLWKLDYPAEGPYNLVWMKFMFSCYTGLRISDSKALKWEHVREGKLFLNMQKTDRPVVVPVSLLGARAQIILDRAKERWPDSTHVFPDITDQEVNRHLKKITVDAQIPFSLNFHVARHTFCTQVANQTGSVFKVMEYAGIFRVDTAMIYINLAKLFD